ncbi:amidase [Dactylonectria macrodidyma]|uniref:Amidase n=1 Tax=Dactylonectria macrodidyma TaxID=307937 RepID=A0A9P9FS58_9HYPO|nr:amidase [Dactylonectria macrodidyma]
MTDQQLSMPLCCGIDIQDLSINTLQNYLSDGKFTSVDLVSCYLERIHRLNGRLRAVIEVNPDAVDIASRLDSERRAGGLQGPLHGIPFLVKDNIATHDKMQTTAGSSVLIGTVVTEDATVVSKLREAGAVLLGHANMSEWAAMRSSYYSEGYSSRGGQGRNPYNLAEHPGGTSSGSAIAVTTNMCAFSLGTETDGSVIFPADRNGIVGIKPTVGRTSCRGVIPESRHFDVVGTLGKTTHDAAVVLGAILEPEDQDKTSPSIESFVCTKSALQGARFGMPWKRVWGTVFENAKKTNQSRVLKDVISKIRAAGSEVVEGADFPSAETIIPPDGWDWDYPSTLGHPEQSEFTVIRTDFYNDVRKYLSTLSANPSKIVGLEDIVSYNKEHADEEGGLPGRHGAWPTGQDNFERVLEFQGIEDGTYKHALSFIRKKSRQEGIDAALQTGGSRLDGLLVPVQADSGVACQVAAKAGYPMITVPVGTDVDGVPFGIGIIQTAGQESLLVKYGSAIEDLLQARTHPEFRNLDADNYMYVGVDPSDTSSTLPEGADTAALRADL